MELGQTAGPCGPGKTELGINQLTGGVSKRGGGWEGRKQIQKQGSRVKVKRHARDMREKAVK